MFVFVSGMIFIGLVCVVLFLIFKNKERCNKTFPPATWTTPLIGCLPMVASKNIAEEMLKLGKKLGPVI
ncbi:unnamed protein product [Allacma fusca]|uniref:Uncharacterized protein n=1 Tax=Allacma fusca TaxID=39272 RepID=A0A8J2NUC0_9HEXA|nr:unnamed protein product [Allacma fusca]